MAGRKLQVGDTGRISERKLAGRLGGELTPGSGNMAGSKGDVKLNGFLIEAKSTVKDSVAIKFNWLCKIIGEAYSTGKKPALAITFTDERGNPKTAGKWVMVEERMFRQMEDCWENVYGKG